MRTTDSDIMRLKNQTRQSRHEADLTGLINIVFLILIFFIVAGALRPFSARNIELAKADGDVLEAVAPGRLIAYADGRIAYRGQELTLDEIEVRLASDGELDKSDVFTVVADAQLGGSAFLAITRRLKSAGFKSIVVMSERNRKKP